MASLAIVERLDVVEDGVGELQARAPALAVEQFDLHALVRPGNCGGSIPWKRMEYVKQLIAEAIPR